MRGLRGKCLLAVTAIAGCSGGGNGTPQAVVPDPVPHVLPLTLDTPGRAVTKIRARSSGLVMLEETLAALTAPAPLRTIGIVDGAGRVTARYEPPAGWALIDFAVHPSGDITVVIATQRDVRIVRLDGAGQVKIDTPLRDAQAASDPFFDEGGLRDDTSLLPVFTRDAVRLAPLGEDLAVALRTGRNAVVAYRFHASGNAYDMAWRTLVEPGLSMFAVGITSGTFDAFGQLANHWKVHLDSNAAGIIAVAVASRDFVAPIFARHAQYFQEAVPAIQGVLVTQVSPAGQRIGTTVIDTVRPAELHGLRMQDDGPVLTGRVFTEQRADGSGWDGWFARVELSTPRLAVYRVVDVDRGDILFDAQPIANARYLAVGASGYIENPNGASIGEHADPLLLVLASDGSLERKLAFASGPRQNQLLSVASRAGLWSVGGLVDAPGTHSGDADPALIRADGLVRPVDPAAP
jgi:hypothetical protein